MGLLIFEFLCTLGNMKNSNHSSNKYLQTQLLIYMIQILALEFPNDGWDLWEYSEDPILHYFQKVINCFLVLPVMQNYELLQNVITYALFASQQFLVLIFILMIIKEKYFHKKITEMLQNFFMKLIYFYLLNINFSLCIPLELFYLKSIFFYKFTSKTCYSQPSFIIGIIGITFTLISQIVSIYFLRCYTFKPFSNFQRKYSLNQLIIVFLQPIVIIFYLLKVSEFNQYIQLIAQNCLFSTLLFEYFYVNPLYPPNNEFTFKIICSTFSISLLTTVNILSNNTLIPQNTLLLSDLLMGSFGYYFSFSYLNRKNLLRNYQQLLSQFKTIDVVQRLHQISLDLKQQNRKRAFFMYYFLLINHSDFDKYIDKKTVIQNRSSRQFIVEFLQNQLNLAKQTSRISFEQVELVFIDYLSIYCKKPLLGLVELRRYDIFHKKQQSFYFQNMRKCINEDLEKLILKQQQENNHHIHGHGQELEKQSLDIVHISKSIIYEDLYLPEIIRLIESKIVFWEQLTKGYNTIYEFQNEAIYLSSKVQSLSKSLLPNLSFDIENIDHLGPNCNVLELKIASIYFSSVMNDYYNSAQCEFMIQEIFNIEHTLSSNIITNFTLVEDKVALVMISLVRSLGEITNSDKRSLAQYFGFDEKEFQSIQFINQLMPQYIQAIHNNLLKDYLQKAKSKLFQSYNLVFSLNNQGFLIPQQLKIDNNFLITNDYVIMGCLSQIKKDTDFILFGEDGKIWGCTENFFSNYIQNVVTLQKFINQCYIYVLIPQIIRILESYKIQLSEFQNEIFLIEETASLVIHQNLPEIISNWSRQSLQVLTKLDLNQGTNKQNTISEGDQQNLRVFHQQKNLIKKEVEEIQEFEDDSEEKESFYFQNTIPLLNKLYQQEIEQIHSLHEVNQFLSLGKNNRKVSYQIQLKFQIIWERPLSQILFYLRNTRYQEKRYYWKIQFVTLKRKPVLISAKQFKQQQIELDFTDQLDSNQNISGFTQTEQPYSEIVPVIKDVGYSVQQRQGHSNVQKVQELVVQYNLDSARDSISYGPLSQRANFINPNQKNENLEDIGRLDQDFHELGLNSASVQIQQNLDVEFEIDESVNKQEHQGKSSSHQDKDKELLNIIQINQLKGKNHEEEEILKSKSSFTSGTSGNSAMQLIIKFQNITHLTQSLKFICFLFMFTFITMNVMIAVHLVIITNGNQETILAITHINGPFVLNRSYLEVISFTWTLIIGSLNIVELSDFIYAQTISDLTNTTDTLYDEISSSYLGFIKVEQKGLLSEQKFTFLDGTEEKMKYPYFINIVEETLSQVVQITKLQTNQFSQVINESYLNNLLLLRYNLNQIYQMTSELIDSLNQIFLNASSQKVSTMQTQVIIEIIFIALILVLELSFWRKIQNYCQQIMLLTGRLQESDANDLIARASIIKQVLQEKSGKLSWKKQNYWILNYQNLNQVNLDLYNTSSRQVKNLIEKSTLDQKINKKQEIQKRNLNVVLSSRIYNTQITIIEYIIMLIAIFITLGLLLFGGFLLFSQQSNDLRPSQTLTANYIKFTSKFDTLMACAQLIKTQELFFQKVGSLDVYDQNTISSFPDTNDIVVLFSELSKIYSENLTSIYQDIISSDKIKQSDKAALLTLYEQDLCVELSDEIPMCNYDDFGSEKFAQVFGQPSLPFDDNREFVNKGIVGIVSRLDSLFKYDFDYEIEYQEFNSDLTLLVEQIKSQEFRNAVFAHFLDTNDGTNTFLEIIQQSTSGILNDNLFYIYLYYGIFGFGLVALYSVFYTILIITTNNRLIRIRLALITLPISILTDQHTISMLKRLN